MAGANKAVMVTGGCGFLGSAFIAEVAEKWPGAKIVNFDNLGPGANQNNIPEAVRKSPNYSLVTGSIRNSRLLIDTLEKYSITHVIHFAAESNIDYSYENKFSAVQSIVYGTLSLLEALRCAKTKIEKFLYVSTDEVYGYTALQTGGNVKKNEAAPLEPTSPYAATKAGAEMLINSYVMAYKVPAVMARICSIYGPGQFPLKVVPKFVEVARKGEAFPIHGKGEQKRIWLHVKDCSSDLLSLLADGAVGETYNIASQTELTIVELAKAIHAAVEAELKQSHQFQVISLPDRPHNDRACNIDVSKFEKKFGSPSKIKFEEGLKQTVQFYLAAPKPAPRFGKVLVWGGKGFIGQQFISLLESRGIGYVHAKTHIGDCPDQDVEKEIIQVAPSHVIAFIGRTHGPGVGTIDYLEGGPDKLTLNARDNLYAPWLLADTCSKLGIHYSYIGSGCLFNYDDVHKVGGQGFTEDDVPNYFGSSYSVIKGYTDRIMHHFKDSVLNVRMRLPVSFDENPRNLVTKIANYNKIADLPNSVTVLPQLLPVLLGLMEERYTGTVNLVNPGTTQHSDTLKLYKEKVNPSINFDVLDLKTDEAKALLQKRSNCALDTSLIQKLAPHLPAAQAALHEAVGEIAAKKK